MLTPQKQELETPNGAFLLKSGPADADDELSWFVAGHGCPHSFLMHGRGIIICSLLGAGVILAGTPGYLARVGPAELRFETEMTPVAESPLPPLAVPDVSGTREIILSSENPVASTTVVERSVSPGSDATNTPPVPDPVESTVNNTLITPQMFIPFFKADSSRTNREIIVAPNVGFNPANPLPSSSATFTQPNK